MRREYPESPIAAVGGIIFREDSVLLAKRNQDPGRGTWTLPGGAVELGETLEDALRREVMEEASIRIEIGGLVRLLDRIVYDEMKRIRFHYVIADYWGWFISGEMRSGSDVSDAQFVPLDRVRTRDISREAEDTILMAIKRRKEYQKGFGRTGGGR